MRPKIKMMQRNIELTSKIPFSRSGIAATNFNHIITLPNIRKTINMEDNSISIKE